MSQDAQHAALEVLLEVARDLTASLAAENRYARLLAAVRRIVPCDAACLLRLDGDALMPLAGYGLSATALARRYLRREHPRLDVILRSDDPVRFPPDSPFADPFDGMLAGDHRLTDRIHACMGWALRDGGEVVGALTADALDAGAFDGLDPQVLATLGALAGAALRTTALVDALERRADHRSQVAWELQQSAALSRGGQMIGSGAAIRRLRDEIALVARSDLAVLLTGETGVGKELVAHLLHGASPRRDEAFIQVNCAALPVSIAESELFGHVAGAFTGANRDRAGKFEVADQGTLFLDEVGELPLELQPKLLRALQHGEIQRVGSDRVHRVDVRIIAATNRNLEHEVERGRFRADLYHRLAVFPLRVPPLRERRDDIPALASHFADQNRRRLGLGAVRISEPALDRLCAADWPGNVRELDNVVSRAVLRAAAGTPPDRPITIEPRHLDVVDPVLPPAQGQAPPALGPQPAAGPLRFQVEEFQRDTIRAAVKRNHGNWAAAARELGMHRSNLHQLARRLGLLDSRQRTRARQ
ncbi:MAG: nitric oxide reductase transcriptional regulator NorR [Vicinamibacterales bacterium]